MEADDSNNQPDAPLIPFPQPAPITIRLVQDPPVQPQQQQLDDENVPPPPSQDAAKRDEFYKYWDRFLAEKPNGKTSKKWPFNPPKGQTSIPSLDADTEGNPTHRLRRNTHGESENEKATVSYEEAAANCRAKVRAIVNECQRLNVKYTDRNFWLQSFDSLVSLAALEEPPSIKGIQGIGDVKRVEEIYENPQFIVDGMSANDVKQGRVGDCWFLAAITALSGRKDLIERVCVDRDEKVGVYGFVFFRDGEWVSEVVDDTLALQRADEQRQFPTEYLLSALGNSDVYGMGITKDMQYTVHYDLVKLPKEFKDSLRKGSNSLYFASCRESNETWLPLLEKAYAKVHGDYQAISGGFAGEGIEDLTGGVSSYFKSETILDKDKLWAELLQVNEESGFLFGCGSRSGRDSDPTDDEGLVRGHAYTVLAAKEAKDPKDEKKTLRLLKVRNPWGQTEWNGPWSDGSKEWTPDMMRELDHTFGDDGIFWISFPDWLRYFPDFERTRLFGPEWSLAQQWTTVNVPWSAEYVKTRFDVTLNKQGPVVLVLSRPDDRYFSGLTGRHRFTLHFRLYKEGVDTYLVRSILDTGSDRSCSAELELEPGKYRVYIKVEAIRIDDAMTAEEVIKRYRTERRDKLLAVGKNFDLAHSKGRLREKEHQNLKTVKEAQRKEDKDELKRRRFINRAERLREKARHERREAERKRKVAIKKAEMQKERDEAKAKRAAAKAAAAAAAAADAARPDEKTDEPAAGSEETKADEATAGAESDAAKAGEAVSQVQAKDGEQPLSPPQSTADEPTTAETTPEPTPDSSKASEQPEAKDGAAESAESAHEAAASDAGEEAGAAPENEDDDDAVRDSEVEVSEVEDDDFEWNSDVDGPADIDTEDDEDEPGMYAADPWNAACVIGLRLYSQDKTAKVNVVDVTNLPALGEPIATAAQAKIVVSGSLAQKKSSRQARRF